MCVGLHVKCLLFLSHFNQKRNVPTNFSKISKYKVLQKSVLRTYVPCVTLQFRAKETCSLAKDQLFFFLISRGSIFLCSQHSLYKSGSHLDKLCISFVINSYLIGLIILMDMLQNLLFRFSQCINNIVITGGLYYNKSNLVMQFHIPDSLSSLDTQSQRLNSSWVHFLGWAQDEL